VKSLKVGDGVANFAFAVAASVFNLSTVDAIADFATSAKDAPRAFGVFTAIHNHPFIKERQVALPYYYT